MIGGKCHGSRIAIHVVTTSKRFCAAARVPAAMLRTSGLNRTGWLPLRPATQHRHSAGTTSATRLIRRPAAASRRTRPLSSTAYPAGGLIIAPIACLRLRPTAAVHPARPAVAAATHQRTRRCLRSPHVRVAISKGVTSVCSSAAPRTACPPRVRATRSATGTSAAVPPAALRLVKSRLPVPVILMALMKATGN